LVASGAITQSQLDQLVGAFRSVRQVIADVLAFAFPRLEEYRIDLNADPEKFVLITGSYTAVLSANPDEVLSCTSLKQSDQLELELAADSFEIDEDADFRFYKVRSGGTREKHEMVMRAIGTLRLEGVRIKLELDDDLEPPGAVIDLANPADRAEAVAIVARIPDLSSRTRAIAALDVERFSTWQISLLRSQDVLREARLVGGRAVCAAAAELVAGVSGADGYVFRNGGVSGRPDDVLASVREAKQRVSAGLPGDAGTRRASRSTKPTRGCGWSP
jgi:hypothetical protein